MIANPEFYVLLIAGVIDLIIFRKIVERLISDDFSPTLWLLSALLFVFSMYRWKVLFTPEVHITEWVQFAKYLLPEIVILITSIPIKIGKASG